MLGFLPGSPPARSISPSASERWISLCRLIESTRIEAFFLPLKQIYVLARPSPLKAPFDVGLFPLTRAFCGGVRKQAAPPTHTHTATVL